MTGGRALAQALRIEGVEHVFGIVGTHSVHLFDGLYDEPDLRAVTVRHEQGAAMMAAGYARASGRIAACYTVPGPGITNALTGVGMAYSESAPLLLVAGQNPLAQVERELGLFHELPDSLGIMSALTSFATRVGRPADVPGVVREAMRVMRCRRPRPAYLEVPMDVAALEADVELLPPTSYDRPGGSPSAVERAAGLLRKAQRPLIVAGNGVVIADGGAALRSVAETLQAPVITTAYAKGVLSEDHPLSLGDGWGQLDLYDEVLDRADAALIVGSQLDVITDIRRGARLPKRIVQVDLEPGMIGQQRPAEVGVVGDAALVLEQLVDLLPGRGEAGCWLDVPAFRRRRRARLEERAGPIARIWDDLRAALPRDTVFVDDLTLVGYWAPLLMEAYAPRTLLHAGIYGTLGYALPAAIGARLARPDRVAVAIVGDGGFLYTLQELATARAERLDLIVLLFNDNAFGALKTFQDRHFGGRQIGADLVNPDFLKLAESFGIEGARIGPDEIGPTVRRAADAGGVWLIEVPFSPPEPYSIPPWMP